MKLLTLLTLSLTMILCGCNSDSKKSTEATTAQAPKTEKSKPKKTEPKSMKSLGMEDTAENVLGGLKVGDKAPDFALTDQTGEAFALSDALNSHSVILTFYRGAWCPYCSKQLAQLNDNVAQFIEKGAMLVAVSPENPEWSLEVSEKKQLRFPILHDAEHTVSRAYKGFYHVTDMYSGRVQQGLGKDIAKRNGDADPMLNVPATYVIGKDGSIKYAFYDNDYSQRADLAEVMAAL